MSFTNLLYHVIFSTKDRRPAILTDFRERMYQYTGGIIRGEGGVQLEIGGAEDHVHILSKLRPDRAIAEMVRLIKCNSSSWSKELDENWPGWQDQYAAFTVSESQVAAVRSYIAGQEEHHRKMSYRDELIVILRKNRVEFDERYI